MSCTFDARFMLVHSGGKTAIGLVCRAGFSGVVEGVSLAFPGIGRYTIDDAPGVIRLRPPAATAGHRRCVGGALRRHKWLFGQ